MLGRQEITVGDIKLTADAEKVGTDVQRLLYRGEYELAEIHLLSHILREGDRVLDIGADMGATGLTAARRVGAANVTSFEANPALEPLIRRNYDLSNLHPTSEFEGGHCRWCARHVQCDAVAPVLVDIRPRRG